MSEESSRFIRVRGLCVCGQETPLLKVNAEMSVLVADCCGAWYLDRGKFVSLLHGPAAKRDGNTDPAQRVPTSEVAA